ncbi:MAG: 4-hydroxy-tetrahydrodipicolinate synthase [Planctomycetota bacterium]|nr:4-hydroxy-tetrahydrodipicolinate synthase [Planctomycetota bacterium]
MAVPFQPSGAWTALITPFEPQGRLDREAYRRLIEFQLAQGIDGLVPAGTTGESPTLTWDEHNEIIEAAVQAAAGKTPVLAGTGSNSTDEAVAATKHAREAGASAVLLVDCYYNKPSSLELRVEYYERVLTWVPEIPIVPYIIPGRSVSALAAADLAILHRGHPKRVPAVKEATGDLERMKEDRALAGPGLAILSGDDPLTLDMMREPGIAAAGVISVMTNLFPAPVRAMVAAQREGRAAEAQACAKKLAPVFDLVVCGVKNERKLPDGRSIDVQDKFPNPVPVKTMMAGLGLPAGSCRPPLGRMTAPAVERCRQALREVYAAAPEFFKPLEETFGVHAGDRLRDDAAWKALARA